MHSSRHFKEIYSTLSESVGKKNIQLQALGLTALTWIFGLAAFYFLADVADPGPAILRVTFIGLAALTVHTHDSSGWTILKERTHVLPVCLTDLNWRQLRFVGE